MNQVLEATEARVASIQPLPRPPADPGGRRGQAVGGLVVGGLFMGSTLLTPIYELYRPAFGLSAVSLTLLYASYVIGNLTALLFFGRLSDQVGRRPVALAGLALAALSTLCFLMARNPAWLFAGRVVSGLAVGLGAGAASAWITEFTPMAKRAAAAVSITTANFLGVAAGPLLSGVLVQYAPAPLRLPFAGYLLVIGLVAALVAATRETVAQKSPVSLKPRLGVPVGLRLAFTAPAVTLFAAMALVGFYAALGPTMIREQLHITNRAISGAVVAELFLAAAIVIVLTRRWAAQAAMLSGLALIPAGLALLIGAQVTANVPLLLVATAVCGAAAALGYRGGIEVINRIAPADRKAEIVSAYFICGFLGNALPVIGVGALSQVRSAQAAHLVFAGVVALLAVAALLVDAVARRRDRA